MPGDAEAEYRGIAEPEGEPGEEADLCDVDRVETPGRIDAIAHRAAVEDAGAVIVADRIGGEAGERVDAVGHVGAADRTRCEPVIEGEREIAGGDEQGGKCDLGRLGALDGVDDFGDVDATKHVEEDIARDNDNGDADHHNQLVQDLFVAQDSDCYTEGFKLL